MVTASNDPPHPFPRTTRTARHVLARTQNTRRYTLMERRKQPYSKTGSLHGKQQAQQRPRSKTQDSSRSGNQQAPEREGNWLLERRRSRRPETTLHRSGSRSRKLNQGCLSFLISTSTGRSRRCT